MWLLSLGTQPNPMGIKSVVRNGKNMHYSLPEEEDEGEEELRFP